MDFKQKQDEKIRKIEDIIDIQKANGNFNLRQVAFDIPSETEVATLAKSLEKNLAKQKVRISNVRKFKTTSSNHHKSALPEVASWPSDSDITVLRMKLCLTDNEVKDKISHLTPGDGLHLPDSSSMVNLATLMLQSQSQSASKHSIIEEYLLPLSSWEEGPDEETGIKETDLSIEVEDKTDYTNQYYEDATPYGAVSSRNQRPYGSSKDSGIYSKCDKKSRVARFLRLYFCPCCTCLYRMEKMGEHKSDYLKQTT